MTSISGADWDRPPGEAVSSLLREDIGNAVTVSFGC